MKFFKAFYKNIDGQPSSIFQHMKLFKDLKSEILILDFKNHVIKLRFQTHGRKKEDITSDSKKLTLEALADARRVLKNKLKGFLQRILLRILWKEIILGTSAAWSTSYLSQRTSKPSSTMVHESVVPLAMRTSILYCRLTDFKSSSKALLLKEPFQKSSFKTLVVKVHFWKSSSKSPVLKFQYQQNVY